MSTQVEKYSVHGRKKTKSVRLEKLTKPFNFSGIGRLSNHTVESLYQVPTDNKKNLKQAQGQVSRAKQIRTNVISREGSSIKLSQKSVMEKCSDRTNNKVKISASQQQSLGLLADTSSATLKQTPSLCVRRSAISVADVPMSDVKRQTADKQQKKSGKMKQDGDSNWMQLCATLNINGAKRKTKPIKRAASNDVTGQEEHSQVKRTKPVVWFDNVDKILIETEASEASRVDSGGSSASKQTIDPLVKPDSFTGVTNCVAMDCEMVGVGLMGEESILARVSVVNHFGVCLYDKYVLPREKVTDYRTHVSGVTSELLATGEQFTKVQSEVSDLIRDRILVGHAIHNDLKVLLLTHPHKMIRDTSLYKPFRELFNGRLPSLKKLTDKVLGVSVQEGQHSSVQDAQATMRLYTMYRQKWEKQLRQDWKMGRNRKKKKKPDNV